MFSAAPTTSTIIPTPLKISTTLPTSTATTRYPGVTTTIGTQPGTEDGPTTEQHNSASTHPVRAVQNTDEDLNMAVNHGMTLSTVHIAAAGAGGGGFVLVIIVGILAVLVHRNRSKR